MTALLARVLFSRGPFSSLHFTLIQEYSMNSSLLFARSIPRWNDSSPYRSVFYAHRRRIVRLNTLRL